MHERHVVGFPQHNIDGQDVITELASEYMLAIADAAASHRHREATGALPGAAPVFSTAPELKEDIPAHFSLEDVVTGQLGIEQVLAGIGADHAQWQWDKPEPVQDVLMLFADGIARRAQSHLPDLTRREHHAISPDSHVAMGQIADQTTSQKYAQP